ncbi:hypothetical protein BsWGS_20938 [Bradybaena similaris]
MYFILHISCISCTYSSCGRSLEEPNSLYGPPKRLFTSCQFPASCPRCHHYPVSTSKLVTPGSFHTLHYCPFHTIVVCDRTKVSQFPGHNSVYEPVFSSV